MQNENSARMSFDLLLLTDPLIHASAEFKDMLIFCTHTTQCVCVEIIFREKVSRILALIRSRQLMINTKISCVEENIDPTLFNPYSAGTDFSRQNLTSKDVRF